MFGVGARRGMLKTPFGYREYKTPVRILLQSRLTFSNQVLSRVPATLQGGVRGGKDAALRGACLWYTNLASQRRKEGVTDGDTQAFEWLNAMAERAHQNGDSRPCEGPSDRGEGGGMAVLTLLYAPHPKIDGVNE